MTEIFIFWAMGLVIARLDAESPLSWSEWITASLLGIAAGIFYLYLCHIKIIFT